MLKSIKSCGFSMGPNVFTAIKKSLIAVGALVEDSAYVPKREAKKYRLGPAAPAMPWLVAGAALPAMAG
jgi:hypothetical protein